MIGDGVVVGEMRRERVVFENGVVEYRVERVGEIGGE